MKKTIVLGITAFNHDSSAGLIKNGKIVAFGEEERFNGIKHTNVFPSQAVNYCLKEAGIGIEDVTDVAFYFNPRKCILAYLKYNNPLFALADPSIFVRKRFYHELIWLLNFLTKISSIRKLLRTDRINLHFVDHHKAHVWYGFYASGFKQCTVLSNDSVGEEISGLATYFERVNDTVKTRDIFSQTDPHSLGYLYGAVTEFLGFTRGEGEGRVMALGSYGTNKYFDFFTDAVTLNPGGTFKLSRNLILRRSFQPKGRRLANEFFHTFGNPRNPSDPLKQIHYDIASGLQEATEKILLHQVKALDHNQIVITGGVAQNSVSNGKISDMYPKKRIYVTPISNDAGSSLGAAIYTYYKLTFRLPNHTETAFLGPAYSRNTIISILKNSGIKYQEVKQPTKYIVDKLINNKTVAIFRGRMECGPRALGNRSILASPISQTMRNHLNMSVKFREEFRPYGGFMLDDKIDQVIRHKNIYKQGPYMSFVYQVKKSWLNKIPSLVHIDKTCRIQIIEKNTDPYLEDILDRFERITGVPILINTSLNTKGHPIARTPQDALSTFFTSALDYIVFDENIVVAK